MACIFCEIVAGRIPARTVTSDERLLAFHDVNPQAPTHVLVIPRRHVTSLHDLEPGDDDLVGAMVRQARDIAKELGLARAGLPPGPELRRRRRLQRPPHPPAPLGGRPLGWPPG